MEVGCEVWGKAYFQTSPSMSLSFFALAEIPPGLVPVWQEISPAQGLETETSKQRGQKEGVLWQWLLVECDKGAAEHQLCPSSCCPAGRRESRIEVERDLINFAQQNPSSTLLVLGKILAVYLPSSLSLTELAGAGTEALLLPFLPFPSCRNESRQMK